MSIELDRILLDVCIYENLLAKTIHIFTISEIEIV